MDLDESRLPLDVDNLHEALRVRGWTGPSPDILGSAAEGHAAVLELLADPARRDLASVVVEQGDVAIGRFTLVGLPSGAVLALSMLVAGSEGQDRVGSLPLIGALAAADALRESARVPAEVSWPDGVTIRGAMCGGSAGSLQVGAVRVDPVDTGHVVTVVIAVGVSSQQLPASTSSLYSEGGFVDRMQLLRALVPQLARRIEQWRLGDPSLLSDYDDRCETLRRVVELPHGRGTATGIDPAGRLVVEVDGPAHTLAARDASAVVTST